MPTLEEFDKRSEEMLVELRKRVGLKKTPMAEYLGIDPKRWNRFENGEDAPTISELLYVFNSFNETCLRPLLEFCYPDKYKGLEDDDDPQRYRDSAVHLFSEVATDRFCRQWNYVIFGEHGSNAEAQMQGFVMLNRLPMHYKVIVARTILGCYDLAKKRGELIGDESIEPDEELFKVGLLKGAEAAAERRNSYNTIMRSK